MEERRKSEEFVYLVMLDMSVGLNRNKSDKVHSEVTVSTGYSRRVRVSDTMVDRRREMKRERVERTRLYRLIESNAFEGGSGTSILVVEGVSGVMVEGSEWLPRCGQRLIEILVSFPQLLLDRLRACSALEGCA
jgi:hypothetical protein